MLQVTRYPVLVGHMQKCVKNLLVASFLRPFQKIHSEALKKSRKNQIRIKVMPRRAKAQLKGATASVSQGPEPPSTPAPDMDAAITAARGIVDLLEATGDQLRWFPASDIIVCNVCRPGLDPKDQVDEDFHTTGLFYYDASDGTNFPKPARLPDGFMRLKSEVETHLETATHQKEDRKRKGDHRGAEKFEKEEVAIRVLRVAHLVLKRSCKLEQFESLVHLNYMNGAHMGDLNIDPVPDMLRFRAAFADVVSDYVTRFLQSRPCVSWVADRITVGVGDPWVGYQTIDVVAVFHLCPENEPDELFQSLVVAVPKITRGNRNAGLLTQWAETADRLGLTDTKKLASVSFGEEFQRDGLHAKFLSKLTSSSQTNSAEGSEAPTVPCLWDGAYMLDLADSAARAEQHCSWVNDTVETIRRLSNWLVPIRDGIFAELAMSMEEADELPFRGIHLWSYIRSAEHSETVLDMIIRELPEIPAAIQRRIDSDAEGVKESTIPQLEADLRLLTGN